MRFIPFAPLFLCLLSLEVPPIVHVPVVGAAMAQTPSEDASSAWPSSLRGMGARYHPNGVEVTTPPDEGPYATLRRGDVITHVNGQPIRHLLHYRDLVAEVHRSGRQVEFTILAAAPSSVSDFTAAFLRGLSVRDHPQGAEIVTPVGEGPLAQFRPGQVIVQVNDQPVRGAAHFRDLMNGIPQRGVAETSLVVITPDSR